MTTLTLTKPDDWHLHVRNGDLLKMVLPHTVKQFARAIIMPNLKSPITTVTEAQRYRQEILAALPANTDFTPLMTLYLTASMSPSEIRNAAESDFVVACKLYPAGATTNSAAGVAGIDSIYPVLAAMEKYDLPLLVHGEVADPGVDIFDRERLFLETALAAVIRDFPALRVVVEHATTKDAIEFVKAQGANIAATLTPQHLLFNRNAILAGGVRPHYYCLPVLKREHHRLALLAAAASGDPKFFLGTDSAPHLTSLKENACGCAGCYTAFAALELYAQAFEQAGALDKLEGFASFYGPDFYRLPRNLAQVTLTKTSWQVPARFESGTLSITPLQANQQLAWKMQ
jgi:dihydroorotase